MFTAEVKEAILVTQNPLERQFIIDYLAEKGYCFQDLNFMPKDQASKLMSAACIWASLKLAEIEARCQFRRKIQYRD